MLQVVWGLLDFLVVPLQQSMRPDVFVVCGGGYSRARRAVVDAIRECKDDALHRDLQVGFATLDWVILEGNWVGS